MNFLYNSSTLSSILCPFIIVNNPVPSTGRGVIGQRENRAGDSNQPDNGEWAKPSCDHATALRKEGFYAYEAEDFQWLFLIAAFRASTLRRCRRKNFGRVAFLPVRQAGTDILRGKFAVPTGCLSPLSLLSFYHTPYLPVKLKISISTQCQWIFLSPICNCKRICKCICKRNRHYLPHRVKGRIFFAKY